MGRAAPSTMVLAIGFFAFWLDVRWTETKGGCSNFPPSVFLGLKSIYTFGYSKVLLALGLRRACVGTQDCRDSTDRAASLRGPAAKTPRGYRQNTARNEWTAAPPAVQNRDHAVGRGSTERQGRFMNGYMRQVPPHRFKMPAI